MYDHFLRKQTHYVLTKLQRSYISAEHPIISGNYCYYYCLNTFRKDALGICWETQSSLWILRGTTKAAWLQTIEAVYKHLERSPKNGTEERKNSNAQDNRTKVLELRVQRSFHPLLVCFSSRYRTVRLGNFFALSNKYIQTINLHCLMVDFPL